MFHQRVLKKNNLILDLVKNEVGSKYKVFFLILSGFLTLGDFCFYLCLTFKRTNPFTLHSQTNFLSLSLTLLQTHTTHTLHTPPHAHAYIYPKRRRHTRAHKHKHTNTKPTPKKLCFSA